MRNKTILFVCMLLAASVILSGCSLVVKDPVKDAARVVLQVNDDQVTKADFLKQVSEEEEGMKSYYANMVQLYQLYYGYSMRMPTDEEIHTEAVTAVHDRLVKDFVLKQKAKELKLDTLTEEETASAKEEAQKSYDEMLQQIIDNGMLGETASEGDALKEEARKYAEEHNYGTLDSFVENALETAVENKVRNEAIKDVAVTDEEVKNQYDVNVADAKTKYAEDISAYGTAVNNGESVYYAPAGYRYVKQILLQFSQEDEDAIQAASSAVSTALTNVNNAQAAVTENETAQTAEGVTEEKLAELKAAREGLDQALTDAKAAYEEAKQQSQQVIDAAFANLQGELDEVEAKIAAGEDFDALMEQYNDDPGMKREPGKTNGYAVCKDFTPFEGAFVDAAMALANIGDVSEPVKSNSYGYYIIKYVADIPEGETGLEAFAETLRAELLSSKQDEAYNKAVEDWTKAAKITYHEDWLTD